MLIRFPPGTEDYKRARAFELRYRSRLLINRLIPGALCFLVCAVPLAFVTTFVFGPWRIALLTAGIGLGWIGEIWTMAVADRSTLREMSVDAAELGLAICPGCAYITDAGATAICPECGRKFLTRSK